MAVMHKMQKKKPSMPRVGPQSPNSPVYGFPRGRTSVFVPLKERNSMGKCGKKGARLVRFTPCIQEPCRKGWTVRSGGPKPIKSPQRTGVYPSDHPLMQKVRRLEERA